MGLALGQRLEVDYQLGRRLPLLLGQVGLCRINARSQQPYALEGEAKRYWAATVREAGAAFVRTGLRSEAQLEQLLLELEMVSQTEEVIVGLHAMVQVWGDKPS